ncbi:MAG TPA: hypothetical protein VFW87_01980 [Pirellulales bacterium]|nr:hypothetical protein [Pirellulales bacterium]
MPRIETRRAHELVYRQRFSRPVRWLGCAGLLVGLLLVLAPWLPRSGPGGRSTKTAAAGVLVAVFSAGLVWGRRGKRFDREAGTVTFWWGAPWAVGQTSYELAAFPSLAAAPYEHGGRLRWKVVLLTSDGERLDLFDLADEAAARSAAEQISQFLTLPVEIRSEPAVSDAAASDESQHSSEDLQSLGD